MIGADVGGEDCVKFVAYLRDSGSGGNIPKSNLAALGGLTAADQQDAPALAELHDLRLAFEKRNHSEQPKRLRVVQKDLMLASDRHDRRPGTAGQRADRARPHAAHKRLQHQVMRNWRRAAGLLPSGGGKGQIDFWLLGNDRLARGSFDRAAGNPPLDDVQVLVGKFVLLRRHRRIFLMRHDAIQKAAVGVAGIDHLAVVAAIDRGLPGH